MSKLAQTRFDRSLVPPAEPFFRANVAKFRARGRRATGLCPFHKDTNPSLSIDLDRGLFHCFTCKASGDIPGFVMLRDGVSFPDACRSLGAWRDDKPLGAREYRRKKHERQRITEQAAHLAERERCLRLEYREQILSLERGTREMRSKLREFKPGQIDTEDYAACG